MINIIIADSAPATRKALTLLLRHKMGANGIVEVEDMESLIRTLADASPEEVIAKLAPFFKME